METTMNYARSTWAKLPSLTDSINSVDRFLVKATDNTIEFLDSHPGIATLLSPSSVPREVAKRHAAERMDARR